MLTRRDFVRSLLIGVGTAAVAPEIILVSEEPIRRYWQVPAGAPLAHRDPHKALIENAIRDFVRPQWQELSDDAITALMPVIRDPGLLLSSNLPPAVRGIAERVHSGDIVVKTLTVGRHGSWFRFGGYGKTELHIAPHLAGDMQPIGRVLGGSDAFFSHVRPQQRVDTDEQRAQFEELQAELFRTDIRRC